MKRSTVLYAVTSLAVLSFTGQAFARGGSMGGGQSHGNSGGTQQMVSTMQPGSGAASGMQQGTMLNSGSPQGPATGSGPQNMNQGGLKNSVNNQHIQMNGKGTGQATMQPPVTTTSK